MDVRDIETDEPPGSGGTAAGSHRAAEVEILDRHRLVPAPARDWLLSHARAALRVLRATGEVRVRIVADAEMADAHLRYSNIPGTTDVLTFDLREDPGAEGPLDVDLIVCADEARRQGALRNLPVEHELLLYILHGVLHCLGEDDHSDDASRRMHAREDQVLTAIGVGPVYARAGEEAAG